MNRQYTQGVEAISFPMINHNRFAIFLQRCRQLFFSGVILVDCRSAVFKRDCLHPKGVENFVPIALEIGPGAIYKAGGSFKKDVYELGAFLPLAIWQGGENLFVNSLQVSFEWHSYPLL